MRQLTVLVAILSCGLMGAGLGQCTGKDKVYSAYGFYTDGDIMTLRSAKYEQPTGGMWSWLPSRTSLSVGCAVTTHNELISYKGSYMPGENVLGYSWEELVAVDAGGNYLVDDEEICDHQCLPYINVEGHPAHPSSGCQVLRYTAQYGVQVYCNVEFPAGHDMNTCESDCDFGAFGHCSATFVRP